MEDWCVELRRGLGLLAHHRPARALKSFRVARRLCPESRGRELADILYYEGISLYKLQMPGRAIRRWVESQRYAKGGYSRKMLERVANEYGMARQDTPEKDDRQAFVSIQLVRYLRQKKTRKLDTCAEEDMILDLIEEYWQALRRAGALDGKNVPQKLELFSDMVIVFPYLEVPESLGGEKASRPDTTNYLVSADGRCACGSGLSFRLCCGRTPGADELSVGEF